MYEFFAVAAASLALWDFGRRWTAAQALKAVGDKAIEKRDGDFAKIRLELAVVAKKQVAQGNAINLQRENTGRRERPEPVMNRLTGSRNK